MAISSTRIIVIITTSVINTLFAILIIAKTAIDLISCTFAAVTCLWLHHILFSSTVTVWPMPTFISLCERGCSLSSLLLLPVNLEVSFSPRPSTWVMEEREIKPNETRSSTASIFMMQLHEFYRKELECQLLK